MPNPFAGYPISDDWAAHRARGSLGGTDWATPVGTPIYAPNPGEVRYEYGNGSGGYIISLSLANSPGYVLQFLHCSAFAGSNRYVSEGELIGYTGGAKNAPGSGSSTGPHVHVHLVDPNGVREDVMPWFANSSSPSSGLRVDGDFGPATKRALQSALGVAVDGDFGPQSTKALQSFLGVPADGSWGRVTTTALQGFLGVPADGDFGRQTVSALQASLNGGTFVKPVSPVAKPEPVKPEPVKPEPVKPEPVKPVKPVTPAPPKPTQPKPIKEKPTMPTKPTPEQIQAQQSAIGGVPHANLGVIIPNAKGRKWAYFGYALLSLLVSNTAVGFAAAGAIFPVWLTVALAIVANLAPAFSAIAIGNVKK